MSIDPNTVVWDKPATIDPNTIKWDTPAAPVEKPKEEEKLLGPWASAAIRPFAKGIAAAPLLAMDAGVAARNLIMGENYEHPSQMFNRALDSYTTTPEGLGKVAEFVSSGLVGAGALPNPTLSSAPTAAAPAVAQGATPAVAASALPKATFAQTPSAAAAEAAQLSTKPVGVLRRTLEKMGGDLPITGSILKKARDEALEAWNVKLLKEIDPAIKEAGAAGFKQASQSLRTAYENIWKDSMPFDRAGLREGWSQVVGSAVSKLPKAQADEVIGNLKNQFQQILAGAREATPGGALIQTQGKTLETVDDALRELAKKAAKAGDGAVASAYNAARSSFRQRLEPVVNQALQNTDELYLKLSTLRNAAKKGFGETITPDKLMSASMRKSSEAAVAEGRGVFQQEAARAAEEMGLPTSTIARRIKEGVGEGIVKGPLRLALDAAMSPVALITRLRSPTPKVLSTTLSQAETQ